LLLTEQVSGNKKQEGETTNKVSVIRIELAQEAIRKSAVSFRALTSKQKPNTFNLHCKTVSWT